MCYACGARNLPDSQGIPEFDKNAEPYRGNGAVGRSYVPKSKPKPKPRPLRPIVPLTGDELQAITFIDTPDPLTCALKKYHRGIVRHAQARGVRHVLKAGDYHVRGWTAFEYKNTLGETLAFKLVQYGADSHRVQGKVLWYPTGRPVYLFGAEQLHPLEFDNNQGVVLVESEKTAVVASLIIPSMKWIATGGANQLASDTPENRRRASVLCDRNVLVLFDADAAGVNNTGPTIDLLRKVGARVVNEKNTAKERHALFGDDTDGKDIADYLLQVAGGTI